MNLYILKYARQRIAVFGLVYFGLGIASAIISNPLESGLLQATIRICFLLIGIGVFYKHSLIEITRFKKKISKSAGIISGAVACGTFFLAIYAVVMKLLETAEVGYQLLMALVIWPLVTGVPLFFIALILGHMIIRIQKRKK